MAGDSQLNHDKEVPEEMARMIDAETVHAVIGELAKVISSLGIDDRGAFESARRRLDERVVTAYTTEII
ncbi:MAG: hypothetical protein HPY71_09660 [Firmicutes bacterium]|nr:hypothetical protein [Bacillota bacterium]